MVDDTDVLVLSLALSKDIPCPLYRKCRTQNRTRFLDITKQLKSDRTYQDASMELGRAWDVSHEVFKKLQEITCCLYVPSTHTADVNLLRYQVFCRRRGEVESSQLPPCEDCLFLHSIRANYQVAIWRWSLQTEPSIPSPNDHGWTTDSEGQLEIQGMRGSPAPDAILQLLSCKCVRSCKPEQCTCLNNGLKCTNLCKAQTSTNQYTIH